MKKIIVLIIGLSLLSLFAWSVSTPHQGTSGLIVGYHSRPSMVKTFYSNRQSSSSSSSGYSSSRSYSGGSYSYGK